MYSTIKSAIKTHIEAITGIKNVYGYEKGDLNGYPSAVVTLEGINCEYSTTREDERKYTFKVKIFQELDADGVGAETAESTMEALIDTVLGRFEDDWDLGGNCYKVNIKGITGYVDRGVNTRVLEFTIDCYAIYSLT
jgi:hypothetical protein